MERIIEFTDGSLSGPSGNTYDTHSLDGVHLVGFGIVEDYNAALFDVREELAERDKVLEQTQERLRIRSGTLKRTEEALAPMIEQRDKADTLLGEKIRQLGNMRGQRDEARAELEEARRENKKTCLNCTNASAPRSSSASLYCEKYGVNFETTHHCISDWQPIPEEPKPVEYACPVCGDGNVSRISHPRKPYYRLECSRCGNQSRKISYSESLAPEYVWIKKPKEEER